MISKISMAKVERRLTQMSYRLTVSSLTVDQYDLQLPQKWPHFKFAGPVDFVYRSVTCLNSICCLIERLWRGLLLPGSARWWNTGWNQRHTHVWDTHGALPHSREDRGNHQTHGGISWKRVRRRARELCLCREITCYLALGRLWRPRHVQLCTQPLVLRHQ